MDYEKVYGEMHDRNAKWFSGYSIKHDVEKIAELVREAQAGLVYFKPNPRLLDYGSGKGYQYLQLRVHELWGGVLPFCYDPGVRQLREKPEGKFDGIICTDVMEHIEESDVDSVLDDIFGYAADRAFIFLRIACRPAKRKKLPDGRDVHLTVKPPKWWNEKIGPRHRDGLRVVVSYDEP